MKVKELIDKANDIENLIKTHIRLPMDMHQEDVDRAFEYLEDYLEELLNKEVIE